MRVVIADDVMLVREGIAHVLRDAGIDVVAQTADADGLLREIVATRQLGEAWSGLCDEMLHQGSVYGVSSAAIPHLIDVAPHLPAASRGDLWIEIGFLVTAGADRFPSAPAPGRSPGAVDR